MYAKVIYFIIIFVEMVSKYIGLGLMFNVYSGMFLIYYLYGMISIFLICFGIYYSYHRYSVYNAFKLSIIFFL